MLDKVSNLLIEPDSLVTVRAHCFSFFFCALELQFSLLTEHIQNCSPNVFSNSLYLTWDICPHLQPEPFSDFLTTLVQNRFPSVFCIFQSDDRVSKLNFVQSRNVESPGGLDLWGLVRFFFASKCIAKKRLGADQKNWWTLCSLKTKTVCLAQKVRLYW